MDSPFFLEVTLASQILSVYQNDSLIKEYRVSTASKGAGEINGSQQTPRGLHLIRAKIGHNQPINTVFKQRRPTGEIYSSELKQSYPDRDWILTRILWLSGLEIGKNRLGNVDTMRRYIYIHGTPSDTPMGMPGSHGCIRMHNNDIIQLFNQIPIGTQIMLC